MALLDLQSFLFVVIGLAFHVGYGDSGSLCTVTRDPDAGPATICNVDSLNSCQGMELTGDVFVTGNKTLTWDVDASPLSFAPDSRVTVSCLRISLENPPSEEMELLPVSYSALLSPSFLRSRSNTSLSALTMRGVDILMSCEYLLKWQDYLCGVQLPGRTSIEDNTITIISWMVDGIMLEYTTLTCNPGAEKFSPICSMAVVDEVADILGASRRLQTPDLPLVLVVSRGLSFNDSSWPEDGLRITANVTLSATLDSNVTISFGLKTVLFTVDKNSSRTAFLSFRGCILMDLPLSYLPLNHPRRPFGVLSTALWPVYREEVAMGLYDCTLILTKEEFKFWSYWLSILVSPIPSVSSMGNWSYANKVQLGTSGEDYIHLAYYYGRYTTLTNVRYQMTNALYATQQRNNILQITNAESVPPTVVFQARDSYDLLNALLGSPDATAAQHGQYIILTGNVAMANGVQWPASGAPIRYPTTITTWPSSWVALDLGQLRDAFTILPPSSSSIIIRHVMLLNLGSGPPNSEYTGLTSGLWAFNFSNWRTGEQQRIDLDQVILVVSREEVGYYITTAVDRKQIDTWTSAFQVDSYDTVNRSWVQFATLATARFTAQALNITDSVPDMFDRDAINITTVAGLAWDSSDEPTLDKKRDVLLFVALAITLPSALGASLMTYLFLKRRHLSRLCRSERGSHASQSQQHSDNLGEDCSDMEEQDEKPSRQDEPPACCFPLSLPLRKLKFVNPLYLDGGRVPRDIVLTGVLGPAALARSLAPVVPEPVAPRALEASISTAACSALEVEGNPAAESEILVEQGTTGMQSSSSRPQFILSVAPAELLQGGDWVDGIAEAAAEGGVSSLPESCAVGLGPRLGCGGPEHGRSSGGASQLTAALQSADATCTAASGGPSGQEAGDGGQGSLAQAGELRNSLAVATDADGTAAQPSARGHARGTAGGICDLGDVNVQRLPLFGLERGQEASHAEHRYPRFMDMQQLDRLRREIGDRHLEVQHSLGWGGCGVVYKGIWKGLQVAVKTILLQGAGKQTQQFLTEAEISASLQHVNIVTTYLYELRPLDEVDSNGGPVEIQPRSTFSDGAPAPSGERISCWKLYIVQEYCEMGTLKAAIDQGCFKGSGGGPPNLAFILNVALDIAQGLAHVHSKNVVHGDVTVSNVLLQAFPSRPQGCIAKVADFGLSVKFEVGQSHGYHLYGGTPHYVAPERVRGVLSKQSDIYSLGVCLWELYCGTPPWRRNAAGAHHGGYGGATSSSTVDSGGHPCHHHHHHHHHGFGDSATPHEGESDYLRFPRGCPPEYSALVLSCLSTDPRTRPTAAAVASTLQRLHRRYC